MLSIHKIGPHSPYLQQVINLYYQSFDLSERDPINHLLKHKREDIFFYCITEDNHFIGFIFLLVDTSIAHLLYFAINPELRNKGYGSRVLTLLHSRFSNKKIIVDCEDNSVNCLNIEERNRRVHFYVNNGYKITNIRYTWHNVNYVILSNKDITIEEFDTFWKHFEYDEDMGEFLYLHFKKRKKSIIR